MVIIEPKNHLPALSTLYKLAHSIITMALRSHLKAIIFFTMDKKSQKWDISHVKHGAFSIKGRWSGQGPYS